MATLKSLNPNMAVADVQASVKFYAEMLGFELTDSVPMPDGSGGFVWAMVTCGDITLMFQERESLVDEVPEFQDAGSFGATFFARVEGLDAYYERLKAGGYVIKEPHTTFYGMREFNFRDPDGYIFTLAEEAEKTD